MVGETGGKDFIFAHASADPQEVATAIVRGAFEYQGQKCSAASRAYVPDRCGRRSRRRWSPWSRRIRVGDVADFRNFINAVIDEAAFDNIMGYIARGEDRSCVRIVVGGAAGTSRRDTSSNRR